MNSHRFRRPLAAWACGGSALLAVAAAHAVYNPPIEMVNGVEYMSGGVSGDEAALMQTVEPRWPASFEFSVKDGKAPVTASAVMLTIRDGSGHVILNQVASSGPILVARLDPGHYEVEATLAGQVLRQQVDVLPGQSSHTVFVWPSGTDISAHS
ncbi:MAG TPA: hypothetical protein VGI11_17720 [Variovorax sp.]|jgi:hypothetical protein